MQIQLTIEMLWFEHIFWLCMHSDLDILDMNLDQSYNEPLGHGQQLFEVSFKSILPVEYYGLNTYFGYVCTVSLTFEIWLWIKVMIRALVIDNSFVKYHPNPTTSEML